MDGGTLVFAVVFAVYAATTSPTIVGGDAGELVAEACQLGTAHPPGYPLFTMVMHVATTVLGDPGFGRVMATPAARANLLCAAFGAAAASLVARSVVICVTDLGLSVCPSAPKPSTLERLSPTLGAWAAGALAGGCWAFSPLVWQYSVTAEVFSLNNLLCAVVLCQTLRFARSGAFGDACLGAFTVGLALTNQHTAVLFAAPATAWVVLVALLPVFSRSPPARVLGQLALLGLSGLLGLAPYVYLPLAAWVSPKTGSWGHVTTLRGLWHHLRRGDYGSFQLYSGGSGSEGPLDRIRLWLADLVQRQSPGQSRLFAGLALVGALALVAAPLARHFAAPPPSAPTTPAPKGGGANRGGASRGKGQGGNGGSGSKSRHGLSLDALTVKNDDVKGGTSAAAAAAAAAATADTRLVGPLLVAMLAVYLVVFHTLANMPLDNKLLFGIHARFWMQPNMLVAVFAGVGAHLACHAAAAGVAAVGERLCKANPAVSPAGASPAEISLGTVLIVALAAALVGTQARGAFEMSDQSGNSFFAGYARGVVEALPPHSLLLINYDQQWTSVRYHQVCEGAAPDVTSLNLAMMTFDWWREKRSLYAHVTWPGTHYTREGSAAAAAGGFTFEQFVAANLGAFPGGVYLGGSLSFGGESWGGRYELVPFGLVSRVLPQPHLAGPGRALASLNDWEAAAEGAWATVLRELPLVPVLPGHAAKYSEETWEWTVGREFFDHSSEHAAYLLEKAIDSPAGDERLDRLLRAAAWLELSVNLDDGLKTSVLKNLGLAYMHVVRDKRALPGRRAGLAPLAAWAVSLDEARRAALASRGENSSLVPAARNVVPDEAFPDGGWKTWASDRFQTNWGLFLKREDATADASYASIKSIYETVRGRAATTEAETAVKRRAGSHVGNAGSGGSGAPAVKKPKKKKKRKAEEAQ